jgi:hypothetical protein
MSNIISLAEARAARERLRAAMTTSTGAFVSHRSPAPAPAPEPPPPPPASEPAAEPEVVWRESAKGNLWTVLGHWHVVVFPSKFGGWAIRITDQRSAEGRFLRRSWPTVEAAQRYIYEAVRRE